MSHTPNATTETDGARIYRIRVEGHLHARWERWFAPMAIAMQAGGETLLTGPVVDQAALHGLIKQVRDLGLALISIERVESDSPTSRNERRTT